ncbi:MAG: DUF58 domain-containing protein [Clostridia bacterium]|nr:DUF58 domain-containing protein [Clostridia bacterium]
MNILIFLLVFLLLLLLYRVALAFALPALTLRRHFSKPAVFEGDSGEMTEIITNSSFVPIMWIRLESSISNALQFTEQTDLDLNGDRHIQSLFTLLPRQRITRRYPVRFRWRGAYSVSSSALTLGDVTGMCRIMKEQTCRADILVWPKLIPDRDLPPLLLGSIGQWRLAHPLSEDPFLIRGLREYRPGDPVRAIHWPTTAKTGRVHIALHDPSSGTRLLILLNGQKTENQWSELMDYEQAAVEYGISLAASLCLYALRQGCAAGFATNLKLTGSDDTPFVPPVLSGGQRERLLDTFARLRISFTLRFETYLKALNPEPGTDLLLLTFYQTDEMQDIVRSLRHQGHRVYVHLLSPASA